MLRSNVIVIAAAALGAGAGWVLMEVLPMLRSATVAKQDGAKPLRAPAPTAISQEPRFDRSDSGQLVHEKAGNFSRDRAVGGR